MKNLKSCLVLGALSSVVGAGVISTSASCIISDKCINFQKSGKRWEVTLSAKRTDPGSDLEDTFFVKWGKCYDEADHALMMEADEEDLAYQALRNDLLLAVQEACAEMYDGDGDGDADGWEGWINVKCDPFDEEMDLDWAILETPDVPCYLKDVYESSCPEPENASATVTGAATTTGESTTTTTGEPTTTEEPPTTGNPMLASESRCEVLDLRNWISCSGGTCIVSQDLIDILGAEPTLLFCDSARLYPKVESSGVVGMYFDDIAPTGLAAALGFMEDDVIIAVEGLPFTNESEFAAIALEIADADAITVTVKRGSSTFDLDFERD
ncbi:PDZ domain-containing protein [Nannocystis pusilla]|uniref:PDZ domain-containing protein n=1 Tax=Nannocystis pusilla TaxID=889268 RepID=A0ABS7TZ65_9BACT|nr:PDZ domain-containing protein [Nannocystis pusilla]MBZ5713563.1 PDZ domain-containing protein [Nannocystis pusilla]